MRETTPIRDFNSCESVKVAGFFGVGQPWDPW